MTTNGAPQDYFLNRDYRESARLYVQHWIWGQHLGYQLHPKIALEDGMRVIDVGTGNAAWVLEVARFASDKIDFVGVDISREQYPADEHLPANVRLEILDILKDLPEDYVEAFDVVHVRTMSTIIFDSNWKPLRDNLLKLLRPGGYIQWDELDCGSFAAQPVSDTVQGEKTQQLLARWHSFTSKSGLDWTWVSTLPDIIRSGGIDVFHSERYRPRPDLFKPFAVEFCLALHDTGRAAASRDVTLLGTAEEWRKMFEAILPEVRRGVGITMDMIVCVGRK